MGGPIPEDHVPLQAFEVDGVDHLKAGFEVGLERALVGFRDVGDSVPVVGLKGVPEVSVQPPDQPDAPVFLGHAELSHDDVICALQWFALEVKLINLVEQVGQEGVSIPNGLGGHQGVAHDAVAVQGDDRGLALVHQAQVVRPIFGD